MNNVILERVYEFKYLGLLLEPSLTFVNHRKNVYNNIKYKLHQLAKVRDHIDTDTALTIYKSMVLPTFDYVDYIWDRDNKGENTELQLLQNKGLRTVYKVRLEQHPAKTTEQMHREGNIMLLEKRRDIHLLFYAFALSRMPTYIDDRDINTRIHIGKRLIMPRSQKPMVFHSALYRAIERWNCLRPAFTLIEDLDEFKVIIKKDYPTCFVNE